MSSTLRGQEDSARALEPGVVVLVHGLWMAAPVMGLLAIRLSRQGFHPVLFGYPSALRSLSENVDRLSRFVAGLDAPVVYLVGHSLGGVVVLRALMEEAVPRARRAVLLATPVNGCQAGAFLLGRRAVAWALGKSVREWLGGPLPRWAGAAEIGVIAGSRSVGLGRVLVPNLPQPNDGVVAVEETRLAGAADHLVLPVAHSEMVISGEVARQVAAFLRTGCFLRPQA